MPVIRNPFARRPEVQVETVKDAHAGFEKVETMGFKVSPALSIRSTRSQDTGDYKMSVVNDSGVYLPPSPTEDKSMFPQRFAAPSRTSLDTRSSIGDIEHFSISRESFDSYRRSFDICARSPMPNNNLSPRPSLDSARFPRFPRPAVRGYSFESDLPPADEGFEEVGLHDEHKQAPSHDQEDDEAEEQQQQQHPKKRGFFSKITDLQNDANEGMARFIPGRRRGQSGQGSELARMERPESRAREMQEMQV